MSICASATKRTCRSSCASLGWVPPIASALIRRSRSLTSGDLSEVDHAHFQLDTQVTTQLTRGLSLVAYGLNLNNEVFGFYNGSPQYVVQREFYKPTFAIGFRYVPSIK